MTVVKGGMTFEEFYTEHYQRACYYVQKKINNVQDAEDLTCNAFMYCYQHFSEYDETKASLSTWLYLVINSRIKNYYRDKKENVDLGELENVLTEDDKLLEQAVLRKEQRQALAKAIKTLPERQQQIVVLKYFYDKSSAEIAEKLGISSGNVRVLLTRALDKLGQNYKMNMDME